MLNDIETNNKPRILEIDWNIMAFRSSWSQFILLWNALRLSFSLYCSLPAYNLSAFLVLFARIWIISILNYLKCLDINWPTAKKKCLLNPFVEPQNYLRLLPVTWQTLVETHSEFSRCRAGFFFSLSLSVVFLLSFFNRIAKCVCLKCGSCRRRMYRCVETSIRP